MNEDRPYLRPEVPPLSWLEYMRRLEEEKEKYQEDIDQGERVIIIDI